MEKTEVLTSEQIVRYMNKKYDDDFSLVAANIELWNNDYNDLVFVSKKLNKQVAVRVSNGEVFDNYMPLVYKKDVEELAIPLVDTVYKKSKVVNIPLHYGKPHFSPDMKFEDYVGDMRSRISFFVATDKNDKTAESDARKLAELFKDNGINATIEIFYYKTDDFEAVEVTDNVTEIFFPLSYDRVTVTVDENNSVMSISRSK